jgi:hypothetical protein
MALSNVMFNQTEDLRIVQLAAAISDSLWRIVSKWDPFLKKTLGE